MYTVYYTFTDLQPLTAGQYANDNVNRYIDSSSYSRKLWPCYKAIGI